MDNREKELIKEAALINNISFEEVCYQIEKLKTTIIDIWEELKELISTSTDNIAEIDKGNKYRSSWTVPKRIVRKHQVINRKPLVSNIRNCI